jgi:hypothetical protein
VGSKLITLRGPGIAKKEHRHVCAFIRNEVKVKVKVKVEVEARAARRSL